MHYYLEFDLGRGPRTLTIGKFGKIGIAILKLNTRDGVMYTRILID